MPVIVSVRVPAAAFLPMFTVRVELPEPVREAGLKLADVLGSNPLTLRFTVPANPFVPATVTV